jgi:hypothetical protein
MNVAITRAKYGLFVIGNSYTLQNNRYWCDLLTHAYERQVLVNVPSSAIDLSRLIFDHQRMKGLQMQSFQPPPSSSALPPKPMNKRLKPNPVQASSSLSCQPFIKVETRQIQIEDGELEEGECVEV